MGVAVGASEDAPKRGRRKRLLLVVGTATAIRRVPLRRRGPAGLRRHGLGAGTRAGLINVKLWRFDRQGVRPSTTYCGGRRTVVRTAPDSAAAAGERRGVVPFETAAALTADALQRLVDRQLTGNSALC